MNQSLAALAQAPAELEQLAESLRQALSALFALDSMYFGPVEGADWHPRLRVGAGDEIGNGWITPPCPELPFNLKELRDGSTRSWVQKIEGGNQEHLALPLMANSQLIGVVSLSAQPGRSFDDIAIHYLEQLAAVTAAGLDRVLLDEELEDRATQMVLLGEISRRLISLRPLEERWLDIAPILSQAFDFCQVQIFEVNDGILEFKARSHQAEQASAESQAAAAPELAEHAVESQQVVVESQAASVAAALPMSVKNRLLGVLYLERKEGPEFSPEEIGMAEMLAGQMAIAVLEAQNYAQQQEYNWYNTVMLEVTRHAAQPGDPSAAMRAVLQLTTMLAGADWALLLLPDEYREQLRVGPSSGIPREADELLSEIRIDRSQLGLQPPYQESERPYSLTLPQALSQPLGHEECQAMTLSDGNILLGLLLVGGPAASGPRQALLAGIGHQLSMRIENTQLIDDLANRRSLERELETARSIQQSFMPLSLPEPENWQVGATWMAARQVGGDFFDFIPLKDGANGPRWGVVIADVADKGVPAALFMALCRTLLRSIADGAEDAAMALDRLNQLILSDTHAELFVSLFYAVWEPATGNLLYANGGHNPPLLYSHGSQPTDLRGTGMVIGVSEKANYSAREIQLQPEDVLIMYTDGVTEAMNRNGVFFGREGLIELIEGIHDQPAQIIAERLRDSVIEFSARPDPPDDLTTVVLKRLR